MNIKKSTPTFGKDKKRRFKCRNCNSYFGSKNGEVVYSRVSDNKIKHLKCKKCGYEGQYSPPIIKEYSKKNKPIVFWNADENGDNGTTTLIDTT